jgi:hypothetical protein
MDLGKFAVEFRASLPLVSTEGIMPAQNNKKRAAAMLGALLLEPKRGSNLFDFAFDKLNMLADHRVILVHA